MPILALPRESHFSPTPPHMHYLLRSAARREDWVLLRDNSPNGWGPPSPVTAPSVPPHHCSPVNHSSGVARPAHKRSTLTLPTLHHDSARSDAKAITFVAGGDSEPDDSMAQTTRTAASNTSSRATVHQKMTSVPLRLFFPSRCPELLPWSPVPRSATAGASTSAGTVSGMGTRAVAAPSARAQARHRQLHLHGHKQQKRGTNARTSDCCRATARCSPCPHIHPQTLVACARYRACIACA